MFAPTFDFSDVVVVADILDETRHEDNAYQRTDLEMSEKSTLTTLFDALHALGLTVHHYQSPALLGSNAARHGNDIVLTIYGGRDSRNRMALVPAICEAYQLRYVGPDTYGRIVCQDKEIAKNLARRCRLRTPRWRVLRHEADVGYISGFPLPFVVKPLFEGSSIGISQRNLIRTHPEGAVLSLELLDSFCQPVLIEEFVPGMEVSFNSIETPGSRLWAYSEIVVDEQPGYFDHHLFDADEKQFRRLPRSVRTIDDQLSDADHHLLDTLLGAISPYGYCRVDGKHVDGQFVFLEITPDAWIAPTGAFARSFMNKGMSYPEVIALVLASAPQALRGRSASDSGREGDSHAGA